MLDLEHWEDYKQEKELLGVLEHLEDDTQGKEFVEVLEHRVVD